MATAQGIPEPGPEPSGGVKVQGAGGEQGKGAAEAAESQALVPFSTPGADGTAPFGAVISRLPVELDVMVPIRKFRVRNLLALDRGQVIETQWGHGDDVPLAAGAVGLAWSEFEVIDNQLTVRITRLL